MPCNVYKWKYTEQNVNKDIYFWETAVRAIRFSPNPRWGFGEHDSPHPVPPLLILKYIYFKILGLTPSYQIFVPKI